MNRFLSRLGLVDAVRAAHYLFAAECSTVPAYRTTEAAHCLISAVSAGRLWPPFSCAKPSPPFRIFATLLSRHTVIVTASGSKPFESRAAVRIAQLMAG
jgi:hypothetical protein